MISAVHQQSPAEPDQLQAAQAMERLGDGAVMVDVGLHSEFSALHIPGAMHVPVDRWSSDEIRSHLRLPPETPLLVVCPSGVRARRAVGRFRDAGFARVDVLAGGTSAWLAAGLPVERGRQAMSLERQVRIAAGSLVALGCALATWVHPGFIALSAAVGCGLVFAGVTDTCGLGMLLARLPWNRGPASAGACQLKQ